MQSHLFSHSSRRLPHEEKIAACNRRNCTKLQQWSWFRETPPHDLKQHSARREHKNPKENYATKKKHKNPRENYATQKIRPTTGTLKGSSPAWSPGGPRCLRQRQCTRSFKTSSRFSRAVVKDQASYGRSAPPAPVHHRQMQPVLGSSRPALGSGTHRVVVVRRGTVLGQGTS